MCKPAWAVMQTSTSHPYVGAGSAMERSGGARCIIELKRLSACVVKAWVEQVQGAYKGWSLPEFAKMACVAWVLHGGYADNLSMR